jgi:S-disulfanyl-L-cysteine oxidoreductase SoxD
MNRIHAAVLSGLGLVLLSTLSIACGGGDQQPAKSPETSSAMPSSSTSPTSTTPPGGGGGGGGAATFEEQAAQGQKLYGAHCASCHGASGEGGKAPKVVGVKDGALPLDPPATAKYRKTQFKTAADIAGFVVKNMPPTGDKLKEDEYWAILAFDLKANGVNLNHKIDASNAASVAIH